MNDSVAATLIAAGLGAGITLVGLIVSKENKVSEFRQQWIDALRADLSKFEATTLALQRGGKTNPKADELFFQLYELEFRIQLRFKREDADSRATLKVLNEMMKHFNPDSDRAVLLRDVVELREASQELLKQEWEVVKKGEKTYRLVLWLALIVLGLSLGGQMWGFVAEYYPSSSQPLRHCSSSLYCCVAHPQRE